jgi:hypothetical protein
METKEIFVRNYEEFIKAIKVFYSQIPKDLSFLFFKEIFCKKTQADKVLWHLEHYGSITNLQCHTIYGIRHAPSVIRELRKKLRFQGDKYRIENEHQKGCNRFGKPCVWDKYILTTTGDVNELQLSA